MRISRGDDGADRGPRDQVAKETISEGHIVVAMINRGHDSTESSKRSTVRSVAYCALYARCIEGVRSDHTGYLHKVSLCSVSAEIIIAHDSVCVCVCAFLLIYIHTCSIFFYNNAMDTEKCEACSAEALSTRARRK